MFVASGAYLAAVFLVADARRAGDADLEPYFARRALAAAAVAGVAAAFGLVELHAEARYIFDRLPDEGLPLVVLLGALRPRRPRPARPARRAESRAGRPAFGPSTGCCGRSPPAPSSP